MYICETVTFLTQENSGYEISDNVDAIIEKSGAKNGIVVIEVPHSTAGIMETTGLPEVMKDLLQEIERVVPSRADYCHEDSPTDSSGHIKCAMFGNSISTIVKDGKRLSKGKIHYYLMEYDGPRHRKYHVAVMGE